jgi:cytoskeletal protein RodZ
VSTILKSLKKLEQQKEVSRFAGPNTTYGSLESIKAAGGRSGRQRSKWIKRGLLSVIILGLGATSIYFYQQSQKKVQLHAGLDSGASKPTKKVTEKDEKSVDKPIPVPSGGRNTGTATSKKGLPLDPKSPIASTAPHRVSKTPPVIKERQQLETDTEPRSASTGGNEPPLTALKKTDSMSRPITERDPRRVEAPVTKDPQVNAGSVDQIPVKADPPPIPAPDNQSPPRKDSYAGVLPLADNRLKVQAIVWSSAKEDRMAVINSRILHEGDTVDGFTVVAIKPDDIIVREKGAGLWRIRFGRP